MSFSASSGMLSRPALIPERVYGTLQLHLSVNKLQSHLWIRSLYPLDPLCSPYKKKKRTSHSAAVSLLSH